MCTTCGCSDGAKATVAGPERGAAMPVEAHDHHTHDGHEGHHHGHAHGHPHHHGDHDHSHSHDHGAIMDLEQEVLAKNGRLAERNRGWLEGREILALNLVSSPGAGKTTLLERTIRDLKDEFPMSVVEGDQETTLDAERIRSTGCGVVQINTGTGCHLDADMLARGLRQLRPPVGSVVMIENVGNLICPALFDLGERAKVAILSVTEGEDKPLKYPHMFRASTVMIVSKLDLLPHVRFDLDRCIANARAVNPAIRALALSAATGEGLDAWYDWLRREARTMCLPESPGQLAGAIAQAP